MAEEGFKRKLTAVFSADVVGYSRLMGADEDATVKTLETYKSVLASLIKQHRGRVVDSPGDNLLAEFASVVDAVQCAVAVQKELQNRNASLPDDRKMQFRIGINLGDVIEEQERLYGDGVNIAARLESLADPGGICISKTAFDHIESKLPFGYQFIGDQTVKNIAKPVGAYKVLMDTRVVNAKEVQEGKAIPFWRKKAVLSVGMLVVLAIIATLYWNFNLRQPAIEPATVDKMEYSLPDKPSIAVLPFTNMSGDPEQEYFSDGLTEEIITALSKVRGLFVVARNATFTYKGKPIEVKQVAEDLGVRYVLEGSVRKSGDQLRITAQLIDAIKGSHLWAERYDREMKDVFDLQDNITKKIITELQVTLTEGERALVWEKGTNNIDAYLKFLQGLNQNVKPNSAQANIRATQFFEDAIALDPQYATAYAWLAWSHIQSIRSGRGVNRKEAIEKAFELAKKAVAMDDTNADCHFVLGRVYRYQKKYENALAQFDRALDLNPNHVPATTMKGLSLTTLGRTEEAISHFKKVIRLNPRFTLCYTFLGNAYMDLEEYKEAIYHFEKSNHLGPNDFNVLLSLARAYMAIGKEDAARETVKKVLSIKPDMTVDRYKKMNLHMYKDTAILERYADQLRKAGLPEK